jgi:ceramide glucosyltransferase
LGAAMDNAHLSASIAPAMVAAMRVANFPIVVGKSMALRRTDLWALGGFESVKDVLAEDFVLGTRVHSVLGKRVVVAHRSITAVSRTRSLSAFFARYARWGTIQRRSIAPYTYAAMLLMHPLPLALFAALLEGSDAAYAALVLVWAGKALLEDAASRALGAGGFGPTGYCALPLKDVMLFAAWVVGCYRSEVDWRGNRLTVGAGTRLSPLQPSSWQRRGSLRRRAA